MDTPTITDLRSWIPATLTDTLEQLGLAASEPDPLAQPLVVARSTLFAVTGYRMAEYDPEVDGLVQLALVGLTLQAALEFSPDRLETLTDFDLLQSFTAGAYSETRRSAADAMKARQINAWPPIAQALWNLMSDDKKDEWFAFFTGKHAPAQAVTEVAWDGWYITADPKAPIGDARDFDWPLGA